MKNGLLKNSQRESSLVLGLIALVVIFAAINPIYISAVNMRDIIEQAVIYGLLGIGMTYVIITGGIDLSVGATMALIGVIIGKLVTNGVSPVIAVIIALISGIILGLVNGLLVTKMHLQPFIATMGTMSLYRGIAYVATKAIPISGIPKSYRTISYGEIISGTGIRMSIVIFIIFAVIAGLILRKTKFGNYLYAIGGNEEASRLSGVKTDREKIKAYIMCGLACAFAAIVLVGKLSAAEPTAGTGYELNAIAAAAIGGTSMAGGRGTVVGTVIGAILFSVLKVGLIVSGVDSYWQYVATGIVIVVAAYIEIVQANLSENKMIKMKKSIISDKQGQIAGKE